MPNNYDYLDHTSVLRETIDTLVELVKSNEQEDELCEKKFNLLINSLCTSCENSIIKSLPPINWYYLLNTLLKSKYGKNNELQLIKLTIYQIQCLNSAFTVFKNLFIDTNNMQQLKVSL